ncbi:hypothetical protein Pan110_52930 [Gimesia panareensis]|nr:hypothetical protein Pan110_52930 [Gimesia panareensis]
MPLKQVAVICCLRKWKPMERRKEREFMDRTCYCCWMRLLWVMVSISRELFHSVEGRVGVKTKLCPGVSSFCPVLSGILSRSVLYFVLMWPDQLKRTWRTGSKCSGGNLMKIDGDSGEAASVILQMQCTQHRPRARAKLGLTYGSAGAVPVESVQLEVEEIQWWEVETGICAGMRILVSRRNHRPL